MADFSGKRGQVNGTFAQSAQAEAPKKRFLSNSSRTAALALALAADFFEQLNLNLLDFEEPIVLPPQEVIDFFVEVPDFELGFEVDFVIVLRAQPISQFGAILTHHDNWRLHRGET
jgi:hypothetical protein